MFSPSFLRRFDAREEIVDLAPVFLAGRFDVINLGRNVRFARDAHELVERFQQLISFAAHVRDVFALVFGRDFAQLDQLLGLRVERRRINERCADAERARLHFLAHELAHLLELLRRRRLVFEADDVLANRGRADERSHVAGNAARFEITQIFRQRVPFDVVVDVFLLPQHELAHTVVHRSHRFAFAHDLGRDALANLALRTPVLNQRLVRPRKHVDEPRRDREPVGLNNYFRLGRFEIAQADDAIATQRKIDMSWLAAGAVVNSAAFDDDVELRFLGDNSECECRC